MAEVLLPALLIIPLAAAVLTLLARGAAVALLVIVSVALLGITSGWLWWEVLRQGAQHYALGGWSPPLGIMLRLDGLAATFVLLTAIVASASGLHALRVFRGLAVVHQRFWPLYWLLWAGLNGIWLAGDLFNLYVGLELATLAAVSLAALNGDARALSAALRYLFAALAGSLAYLLGVALLYGSHGMLSLELVATQVAAGPTLAVALALILLGLAVKTALFPLHGWLAPAHGSALAPVSALLSGLVIKGPFYVMLRLWMELGGEMAGVTGAQLLGTLGVAAMLWGGWMALHEHQLKHIAAYSTVAQIGTLLVFIPLATGTGGAVTELARNGMVLMAISHALAKAALFLAAGNLVHAAGSERVDALAGASRLLPWSLAGFALAGFSLMGLPPTGGFAAKWLLLQASILAGQWWWAVALLLGGVLTGAYVFRVLHHAYRPSPGASSLQPPALAQEFAPLGLALTALLLGPAATLVLAVLGAEYLGP